MAQTYRVELADGTSLVAKWAPDGGLAVEGRMLTYLAEQTELPVPAVQSCDDHLLLMDYVPNRGWLSAAGERQVADQLATLHRITAPAFGLDFHTVIGMLPQPNGWQGDWCGFYRDQRLLTMGRFTLASDRLPAKVFAKLETLCGKLDRYLPAQVRPSLIHGDVWSGNLLCRDGAPAAYIDPAIYFAHDEMELAYIEFLGTLGRAFFDRYQEHRPIEAGYGEARRDLYQLFPLLVHCQITGEPYLGLLDQKLSRFV